MPYDRSAAQPPTCLEKNCTRKFHYNFGRVLYARRAVLHRQTISPSIISSSEPYTYYYVHIYMYTYTYVCIYCYYYEYSRYMYYAFRIPTKVISFTSHLSPNLYVVWCHGIVQKMSTRTHYVHHIIVYTTEHYL